MTSHVRAVALAGVLSLVTFTVSSCAQQDATLEEIAELREHGEVTELLALAERGNTVAQYNLGEMYHIGEGVPTDYVEAVRWYKLAAKEEHAGSQFNLGVLYANGRGVPQDFAQAVELVQLAAEQNHADAQYALGLVFAKIRGTEYEVYIYSSVAGSCARTTDQSSAAARC